MGERLLTSGQRAEDPLLIARAHVGLGWVSIRLGRLVQGRDHLKEAEALYQVHRRPASEFVDQINPWVVGLCWLCMALQILGYADQALRRSEEALALAQELDHWDSPLQAACTAIEIRLLRGEPCAAQEHLKPLLAHLADPRAGGRYGPMLMYGGWLQVEAGRYEEGIAQMHQGFAAFQRKGFVAGRPWALGWLAMAHGRAEQPEEGLSLLVEALDLIDGTGETWCLAEVHRIRGNLLLMQGDEAAAEASFLRAIEVARQQQARFWELRATVCRCRLWQKQGKPKQAKKLLADIYGWFTEGFDTGDLQEAWTLLSDL